MYRIAQVGDENWSATLKYGADERDDPDWTISFEIGRDWRGLGEAETARRCSLLGDWACSLASYQLGCDFLESCGYAPRPGELEPDLNRLRGADRVLWAALRFKTLKQVKLQEAAVDYEGFLYAA